MVNLIKNSLSKNARASAAVVTKGCELGLVPVILQKYLYIYIYILYNDILLPYYYYYYYAYIDAFNISLSVFSSCELY